MKKPLRKTAPPDIAASIKNLRQQVSETEAEADTTLREAQVAKARYKAARKAYKVARKQAKKTRKLLKALNEELNAILLKVRKTRAASKRTKALNGTRKRSVPSSGDDKPRPLTTTDSAGGPKADRRKSEATGPAEDAASS